MVGNSKKIAVFWFLLLSSLLVDQATKEWLFSHLPGPQRPDPGQYLSAHKTLWKASDQVDVGAGQIVPPGFHLHIAYTIDEDGNQVPHVNQGALFGMGGTQWRGLANGIFALVSLLVAVALTLFVSLRPGKTNWILVVALGLVAGGAVGNLMDRVRFQGVRDFLHWNYLFDWPVFNMADVFLVIGAGLILLVGMQSPEKGTESSRSQSA